MSIREIVDLMERHVPCPPDPMPEPNSVADYLWRATAFNAGRDSPLRIVKLMPTVKPYELPPVIDPHGTAPITLVECDVRGRGIRIIR